MQKDCCHAMQFTMLHHKHYCKILFPFILIMLFFYFLFFILAKLATRMNVVYVKTLVFCRTFALAGAKAPSLVIGRGRALIDWCSLLVALTTWDFSMHLVRQIP